MKYRENINYTICIVHKATLKTGPGTQINHAYFLRKPLLILVKFNISYSNQKKKKRYFYLKSKLQCQVQLLWLPRTLQIHDIYGSMYIALKWIHVTQKTTERKVFYRFLCEGKCFVS